MCELFAMVSRSPARVTFSFEAFARRGGGDAPHRDGWGVAFCHGRDVQLFREAAPAAESPMVRFLRDHPPRSAMVISHVRLATLGTVGLANTQPLSRELGGRAHVFAHNGHLPGIPTDPQFRLGSHRPVGDTDSERAFCALLARLEPLWQGAVDDVPTVAARRDVVATFAHELSPHGPANFVYTDGDALFVHGHRRTQADKTIGPPGLFVTRRTCAMASPDGGIDVAIADAEQQVVLVASVPLTKEPWRPLAEGEVLVAQAGALVEV